MPEETGTMRYLERIYQKWLYLTLLLKIQILKYSIKH